MDKELPLKYQILNDLLNAPREANGTEIEIIWSMHDWLDKYDRVADLIELGLEHSND